MARFNPGLALTFFFADLLRFFTCKSSTTTTAWLLLMRSVRGLMHEIFSHIGDVLVQFADFGFPFLPVDRELLLASQPTLQPCQTLGLLLCCNGPFLFGFIALLVLRQGLV